MYLPHGLLTHLKGTLDLKILYPMYLPHELLTRLKGTLDLKILYPMYLPHELLTHKKETRMSDAYPMSLELRGTVRAGLLDVDHPRNAKAIDAHAEACGPERRLIRHLDLSVF